MGKRRVAREAQLKMLYESELSKSDSEFIQNSFWEYSSDRAKDPLDEDLVQFANGGFKGVLHNQHEIDRLIEMHSTNWKVNRMTIIDRNILRIAVYELLYCQDIPSNVTINEAIEIGKKFGTEDSGAFINGILDKISKELEGK